MTTTIRDLAKATMAEQNVNIRELAKAIGYSGPSISQYLAGKYGASTRRLEAALSAWLRRNGKPVRASDVGEVQIATRAAETIVSTLTEAFEAGDLAVIIGPPGCGKTNGLRAWEAMARAEEWSFISIQASVVTTPVTLLRGIGAELGIKGGNAGSILERIIEALQRKPSFIIVDEAQHLPFRALEALRAIRDATSTGVVFCGSVALERTLLFGDTTSVELAQLQDRVAEVVRVGPLTPVEVTRFCREILPELKDAEAVAALRDVSRSVPRRVVRLLTHLRKLHGASDAITVDMVREAGSRLVVS